MFKKYERNLYINGDNMPDRILLLLISIRFVFRLSDPVMTDITIVLYQMDNQST